MENSVIVSKLSSRHGGIPAGFSLHFPEEYRFGKNAVTAHRNFLAQTGVDFLKVMNESRVTVPAYIVDPEDWSYINPFDRNTGFVRQQLDIIKALADTLGDSVPLIATIHGVFASAFHACRVSEDRFSRGNPVDAHLRLNSAVTLAGMRAIAEGLTDFALACLDAGAAGIYYAALGGEEERFSAEEFEAWIKPLDLQVLRAVQERAGFVILHICKNQVRLPLYADYPAAIINWAIHESNPDLAAGAELFRDRIILGGLDDRDGVLVHGTQEEIAARVTALVSQMREHYFILGADCTLPTDIDLKRIQWAVEAAHKS